MGHRSGLVAVVGRPNVGKSSIVNALVGRKVAIVSDKPQTTRRDARAILTTDSCQIVFTDTPGFHKPKTLLGERLNERVGEATHGVDAIVMVVDAHAGAGSGDEFVYAQKVRPTGSPALCAVNKIDLLRRHGEVPQLQAAADLGAFDEIVPTSARTGRGIGVLLDLLVERMPEGPPLYPENAETDQPIAICSDRASPARHRTRSIHKIAAPNSATTTANPGFGPSAKTSNAHPSSTATRLTAHVALFPCASRRVGLPKAASPSRSRKSFRLILATNSMYSAAASSPSVVSILPPAASMPSPYGTSTYATARATGAAHVRYDRRMGRKEYTYPIASEATVSPRVGAPASAAAMMATGAATAFVRHRSRSLASPVTSGRPASSGWLMRSMSLSATSFAVVATT